MTAPTAARVAALATLRAVREGELAGRAFEAASHRLDVRDRAWAQELAYGTLRLRGRLDHMLAGLSRRPLERLDPDILEILRLGAYQLTAMDGVPAYAAVSQAVELAKGSAARGAAGFVNGVLQSLRRAGMTSTFPDFAADPVAHLSTWGSHPRWLVERWVDRWGADAARRLVEANNKRPELYLRGLAGGSDVIRLLAEAGVDVATVPGAPGALHVRAGPVSAALAAAPVIVQDPAAGLVVTYAGAVDGLVVADLAAAPGGKALALADRAAFVVASDVSAGRLARARENLERLTAFGPVPVGLLVADGRRPALKPVDVVLLDAPCTGTGTLRRHPDGRWRIQPRDMVALVRLQAELLDAAATLVRPGGLLLYSTCSLEREENEEQVKRFLAGQRQFEVEPGPALAGGVIRGDGMLEVLPHEHGWDGAFAARLRRRG
ncbi:MAG TPA: 16S rRNA (cytosine(967)-C(5))-methyltransferase RsmB [Longimicrobiales bacterium]|nr:16S rRNA (cytosine(967)-C(5))-methyltransferase RsmB [Longimicrobiales bacterium]